MSSPTDQFLSFQNKALLKEMAVSHELPTSP